MTTRKFFPALVLVLLSVAGQALAQTGLIQQLPLDGNGAALVGTSGTLVNEPVPAADRLGTPGGALAFSGALQQYVSVPGGGGLNNLQAGTIAMFVNWTGIQQAGFSSNGSVLARQSNGGFSNNVVGLSTTNPATARVTWQPYNAGSPAITGSTIVGDHQWRHVAITFSPGSHRLYIDGVLDGSSSINGTISNNAGVPLTIGAWTGDGRGYSTSAIHDFRVFNRVLSQEEIRALINTPPIANAGADRAVFDRMASGAAATVLLDGTASYDPEYTPLTYAWVQTDGPAVVLAGANTATPSFLAPSLKSQTGEPQPIPLSFRLTVSDGVHTSEPDEVVITVKHFNLPPTAAASAPATAAEGTSVTLDGSASIDPDQDSLSYLWTQTSGTAVDLPAIPTNSPTLVFSANLAGPHTIPGETLHFTLTVSDGIAADTTAVAVFIQNVNQAPTAEAAPAAPVFDNVGVCMLSGSASDPDGDSVSLRWEQVAGTPVALQNADSATPSFMAPAVSPVQRSVTLTFQLIANDASAPDDEAALDSAPATVDVLVRHANRAPVADAGMGINAPDRTLVTLDGSGSYDPDLDPITYAWTQTGGPAVELDTTDPVHPTFRTPALDSADATLVFELRVSDTPTADAGASLTSAPSTVTVHVKYVNRAPTARTGPTQTVGEGTVVSLDGSQSSDPDGNTFTYLWTQTSGPMVTDLSDATSAKPSFSAPLVDRFGGTVVFALQTTDQFGALSNVATTSVEVSNINRSPLAEAGRLQSVKEDTDVALLGTGFDPDTEEEPLLTYVWKQTAGPVVALIGAHTPNPTFHAPMVAAGEKITLKFALTVADPNGALATAETSVCVTNVDHAPLANAGSMIVAAEAVLVTLDGTASSDPDGDALTYAWVQTAGPAAALANASTATPSFTAPFVGAAGATLKFQLAVNDGFGGTSSDTVTVAVSNINDPPTLTNARASIERLWPPNHRMVPVSILGVVDVNNNATITITSVKQDEPTSGLGGGDTAIDAIITGDATVLLRAERSEKGNGRVYHIHFTAADIEGSVSGAVKVFVPRNQATSVTIDGGELFDSTR